jgi:hypothetical protein
LRVCAIYGALATALQAASIAPDATKRRSAGAASSIPTSDRRELSRHRPRAGAAQADAPRCRRSAPREIFSRQFIRHLLWHNEALPRHGHIEAGGALKAATSKE